MQYLENRTFKEIRVGDESCLSKTLSREDIELFAIMSGDTNSAHLDDKHVKEGRFHEIIAHGMWHASLLSTLIGTKLPGPGSIYLNQTLEFLSPVTVGDTVTVKIKVKHKEKKTKIITLKCSCINQDKEEVITGEARVVAPTKKIKVKKISLPEVELKENKKDSLCNKIIRSAQYFTPLVTAIVQPTDKNSLEGAISAAEAKLITPILIGESEKIKKLAKTLGLNIKKYKIVPTKGDTSSVLKAIELAKKNKVEAIMKGNIHTDRLLEPIVAKENGLTTDRRVSHVFALDVPSYHKLLFLTDAAINIMPSLSDKKSIVQNAIDLFHILELGTPKVAIISATETLNEKMPATLDAAALCKMSERGQIEGGVLDGPLAFDNAISKKAAKAKGIISHVAGDADILVVPNIETGNALYKQMRYMFDIAGAGIVLGTKVPIILTSRAAGPGITRKFSCAISLLYARHKSKK